MNVQKASHVWTQAEVDQGWAVVHIDWRSPFPGTKYVAWFSVEDLDPPIDLSFFEGDMHNFTETGFDAIVYLFTPGAGTAGDRMTIHAFGQGM
jgi:hypothetical protein